MVGWLTGKRALLCRESAGSSRGTAFLSFFFLGFRFRAVPSHSCAFRHGDTAALPVSRARVRTYRGDARATGMSVGQLPEINNNGTREAAEEIEIRIIEAVGERASERTNERASTAFRYPGPYLVNRVDEQT